MKPVAKFAVHPARRWQKQPVQGSELQEVVRYPRWPRMAPFRRAVFEPRRRGSGCCWSSRRRIASTTTSSSPPMSRSWASAWSKERRAGRLDRERPDPCQTEADYICVRRRARPCIVGEWIDKVLQAAEQSGGGGFAATPVHGNAETGGRSQDPGDRLAKRLVEAHAASLPPAVAARCLRDKRAGFAATDDAQLVEWIGHPVTVVPASPINLKITTRKTFASPSRHSRCSPKPKLKGLFRSFADDDMWR